MVATVSVLRKTDDLLDEGGRVDDGLAFAMTTPSNFFSVSLPFVVVVLSVLLCAMLGGTSVRISRFRLPCASVVSESAIALAFAAVVEVFCTTDESGFARETVR